MSPPFMFDDQLLRDFIDNFYGYGNYSGKYWFVGMEEGGGSSFADVQKRLDLWSRERHELEDVAEYHEALGAECYFNPGAKIQPTWNRLIRIVLSADGQDNHTEQVRTYQQRHLGRHDSNNCLVELFPLPSPSTSDWLYAQHTSLPFLMDREKYTNHCAAYRVKHLQLRIHQYQPKAVIFYSVNPAYIYWWKLIAGVEFKKQRVESRNVYIGKNEHTIFAIATHPVTRGITNEYFHQVGKLITSILPE